MRIGDWVIMSKYGMLRYGPTPANPHGIEGRIYEKDDAVIRVNWRNGHRNTYRKEHLIVSDKTNGMTKFIRKVEGCLLEEGEVL